MIADTAAVNTNNGISNALDSKLNNILDAWDAETTDSRADVLNKLASFVNHVEAQRGNMISDADADFLVAAALKIADNILLDAG